MKAKKRPELRALLLTIAAFCSTARIAEANSEETVDRIVARANVIFSGRMEYTCEVDKVKSDPIAFSFQGASWARRYSTGGALISHDGRYIEYVASSMVSASGHVRNSAHVFHAKKMTETHPYPPFFAGTFWYAQTADYIKRHRNKAREVVWL